MEPPSYMRSVVGRNVVIRRITIFILKIPVIFSQFSIIPPSINYAPPRKGSTLASQD